ncbi:MAG: sulfotransferase [Thioploca sp.]|nr:sulfotransferase [Thioploca sp.]
MKKPNFFIVGAPKCGTTALSEYLSSHPNVFMSYPKEPHYFSTDMPNKRSSSSLEDYLQLFKKMLKHTYCYWRGFCLVSLLIKRII